MKVTKSWSPDDTWEFEKDGKKVVLKSYYIEVEGDDRKFVVHRKPESDPIIPGKEYPLQLTDEKTKSGKYYKARIKPKRTAVCPKCGHEFEPFAVKPASEPSRDEKNEKMTPDTSEEKQGLKSADSEPPLSNYDDIEF